MPIESQSTRAQLLALLRKGHSLTQAEMTRRLPIDSKRQARRHIEHLREDGVRVEERQRGREKEFYLPPDALTVADAPVPVTERQALALVVAAEAGRAALAATPLSPWRPASISS